MAETNSLSLIEINTADNKTTKYAINEMVLAILLQWIPVNFGGVSRAQNALTLLTDNIILAFYKAKLDAQSNGLDKITVWLQNFQGVDVDELYNFVPATYDGAHVLINVPNNIPIELNDEELAKIISVIPKTGRTQAQLFADQIRLVSTAVLACYNKLTTEQQDIVNTKNKLIIMAKVNNNDAIAAVAVDPAVAGAAFGGPPTIKENFINQGIVYAAPAIAAGANEGGVAAAADTTLANELGVTPFAGNKPANWNFKMWCSLLVKIANDGVEAEAAAAANTVAEVIDIKYTGNDTKSLLFDQFESKIDFGKIDKFWKEYLLSTGESKLTGGKRTRRRRNKGTSKRRSQKGSQKGSKRGRKRSNKRKGKKSRKRMRKSYKK